MLWTRGGQLLMNADGDLIDCEECPCVSDSHESPCNGLDSVPGTLDCTISFNGNTIVVPLTWIEESPACSGSEGWEYTGGRLEICSGLDLAESGVAICCDGTYWTMQIAVWIGAILDSFITPFGLEAVTVVDTSPLHYTTQTTAPFGACSAFDDLLVDIEASA